jgi:hypothetical protein
MQIRIGSVAACVLALSACTQAGSPGDRELAAQVDRFAASSEYQVSHKRERMLLAIEVRVKPGGVEAADVKVVRAPMPTGSGMADLLVRVLGTDGVRAEYTVADPLLAETEDQKITQLTEATIWIYAPAEPGLQAIEIGRVREDDKLTKGGSIDLRPLIRERCTQYDSEKTCFEQLVR